jgi:hypothetical protein
MAVKTSDNTKYFIISAYAPCLVSSTQVEHLAFLRRVTNLALEKRPAGYESLIFGDLNWIGDNRLDAKNGGEVFQGQLNWFTTKETNADLHDVQRYLHPNEYLETWSHGRKNTLKRFRCLDYILASISTLAKITEVKVTPTLSDHRMLTLHLSKKEQKVGGPGYWQHPDSCLKDQYYVDKIDFALDAGLESQTDLTDKRAFWDWLKFCGRSAAIQITKKSARERRIERTWLEDLRRAALQCRQRHRRHSWRSTTLRIMLQYDFQFFFNQIKQNQKQSNVERLCTPEFSTGHQH